ncbi:hypothetical protein ACFC36_15955 [Streptomyces rubiginosohelvolus]|uniref:hypothetical protein n=1 Tax=Streptomyces rubiginosohelvolus TaxID=67362 RepID=UPI0035D5D297
MSELVVEATSMAHGAGNIAGLLGGRVIPQTAADSAPTSAADPWAEAQNDRPAPKDDSSGWILGEIDKQTSIADLQRLWAANQTFFSDEGVMAAYKAKGRALKAV